MKDYLFISATHGDEGFSVRVLKRLVSEDRANYDWIIGNEKAYPLGKRFLDVDLNRVAPGEANSEMYESRRAFEIIEFAKSYKAIIDLHGTTAKSGIFVIVTKNTEENLLLAERIPVENVVIWEGSGKSKTGPITSFVKPGIEIECGPKDDPEISKKLYKILKGFLDGETHMPKKRYFTVYGKIFKNEVSLDFGARISDFELVKISDEEFYPLLVNQYPDLLCYKMREIKR